MDVGGSLMVGANDVAAIALVAGTIASVALGRLEFAWGPSTPSRTRSLGETAPTDYGLLEYRFTPEQILAPSS